MVRAQDLPVGAHVHDPEVGDVFKLDTDLWTDSSGREWVDRQVDILLDSGAAVVDSAEQATT